MFRRYIGEKTTLTISMGCNFTTKSGGIWIFQGRIDRNRQLLKTNMIKHYYGGALLRGEAMLEVME